nr:unnamed protein product [Haemonchus contortus]
METLLAPARGNRRSTGRQSASDAFTGTCCLHITKRSCEMASWTLFGLKRRRKRADRIEDHSATHAEDHTASQQTPIRLSMRNHTANQQRTIQPPFR